MDRILGFFERVRLYYHDYIILGAAVLAFLLPVILYVFGGGTNESISLYHCRVPVLLFCLLGMMALGFMTGSLMYRVSGLFLFGLAIVNIELNTGLHNIIAGLFFIHTTRIILFDKKFSAYSIPILMCMVLWICGIINLYLAEIITVMSVALFTVKYSLFKIEARGHDLKYELSRLKNLFRKSENNLD